MNQPCILGRIGRIQETQHAGSFLWCMIQIGLKTVAQLWSDSDVTSFVIRYHRFLVQSESQPTRKIQLLSLLNAAINLEVSRSCSPLRRSDRTPSRRAMVFFLQDRYALRRTLSGSWRGRFE